MDISQECSVHPERTASWYCWNCGLPFCEECVQPWQDQYICETCSETLNSEKFQETPDGWPEHHREANLVSRLLAFFVDFTLMTFVTIGLVWLFHHLLKLDILQTQYLYWLIFYGGMVLRDGLLPGGSPGKRLVGLYVWNVDLDRPVTGIDSIRRNLVLIVFFVDVLMIPFNRRRRRSGDYLAGTMVCDRLSRRSKRTDFFRLAGVVFVNLLLILSIYAAWLNQRARRRVSLRKVLGQKTVTSENIVSILRKQGRGTHAFDVVRRPDGLVIEAELDTATRYYEVRRRVKKILRKASYEIISEPKPELVFRGRNKVHFRLRIKAIPGKD